MAKGQPIALGHRDEACRACLFMTEFVCATCGSALCPKCADLARCTHHPVPWNQVARQLITNALDVEDKAVVEGAAMLAAGHGVRFVFTIQNGRHVDVKAERLDYDVKGQVR